MIGVLRRITALAVPVVLVAGVLAAVLGGGGRGPEPTQARLAVDGEAVLARADGTEVEVSDEATADFGDVVEVRSGTATLTFAGGATYELRHHDGVGSVVVVGSPPRVTSGDVLVADGFPARIQVGAATLSALGALKVSAGTEVAAAYEGRASVAGAGDATELRRLRQLVLVPGATPEPLEFDGSDPWDRRHLGEAIAFGERLEALARGYTSDLPPDGGRTAAFLQAVIPALADQREFGDDLLDPARPPGETLVGAAIAVQGDAGNLRERWAEIFEFRAAGAAWGLVALDQGVSSAPVLETIELAIDSAPSAALTSGSGSATSTSAPGADPSSPTSEPPNTTTTAPAPPPPPPPSPSDGLLDPTEEPSDDVLGDLLDDALAGG